MDGATVPVAVVASRTEGPGVSVEQVIAATEAKLVLPEKIPPKQI